MLAPPPPPHPDPSASSCRQHWGGGTGNRTHKAHDDHSRDQDWTFAVINLDKRDFLILKILLRSLIICYFSQLFILLHFLALPSRLRAQICRLLQMCLTVHSNVTRFGHRGH